jgi:hypothetical protein
LGTEAVWGGSGATGYLRVEGLEIVGFFVGFCEEGDDEERKAGE